MRILPRDAVRVCEILGWGGMKRLGFMAGRTRARHVDRTESEAET